jgi:hypothetical protein
MGTWKSVAVIQVDRIIPDAHLLAAHLHDHPDQIQIGDAKIYQRAVVHLLDQVFQVEIAKGAMRMIRAVFVQRQWIAINHDCVREFSNQIFLKM